MINRLMCTFSGMAVCLGIAALLFADIPPHQRVGVWVITICQGLVFIASMLHD